MMNVRGEFTVEIMKTEKPRIIPVTTGDIMHLMGGFGLRMDYTVRMCLRLTDPIDEGMLREAVVKTQKRFPYLSLRLRKNDQTFWYEENPLPVVLLHTKERISLNSEQTNFHVWAVCWWKSCLYLDIFHGITDGTAMYMVLSTLLYYYCNQRYGVMDHTGIRTLEDPILPGESDDPADHMPQLDPSMLKAPQRPEAFSLTCDASLMPSDPIIYDVEMPEQAFVRFSSAHDASPGTMVSILFSRAIDELFPERKKPLTKPVYKEKLRLRSYGIPQSDSTVFFEIKKKYKGVVYKRRIAMTRDDAYRYIESGELPADLVGNIPVEIDYMIRRYRLFPKAYIDYHRLALVGNNDPELRITFDSEITSRYNDVRLESDAKGEQLLPEHTHLMEIKIPGAMPLWLAHVLSEKAIYPQSFSKFGTAHLRRKQQFLYNQKRYKMAAGF